MPKSGFLITQIKQRQDRIFEKLLEQHGLSLNGSQGRILYVLWSEEPLTMSMLSQRTSLANNTLSNVIDRMVQQNLVQRVSSMNRRQVLIGLSDFARSLQQDVETVSEEMNNLFYEGLTTDQIELLDELLELVLHNLIKKEESSSRKETL